MSSNDETTLLARRHTQTPYFPSSTQDIGLISSTSFHPSLDNDDMLSDSDSDVDSTHHDSDTLQQHSSPTRADANAGTDPPLKRNISVFGPKMRIHSLAPWETDWDLDLRDVEDDSKSETRSIFGGRSRRTTKPKDKKSGGALMGMSLVSPRFMRNRRSSVESTANFKPSELDNGYDISMSRASHSTTSLNITAGPSVVKQRSRSNSRARSFRSQTPISSLTSAEEPPLPQNGYRPAAISNGSPQDLQHLRKYAREKNESPDYIYHPFANPDNILSANRLSTGEPPVSFPGTSNSGAGSTLGDSPASRRHVSGPPLPEYVTRHEANTINRNVYASGAPPTRDGASPLHGSDGLEAVVANEPVENSHQGGRTLKQKKSAILRLFNKDKDRDITRRRAQTLTGVSSFSSVIETPSIVSSKGTNGLTSSDRVLKLPSTDVKVNQVKHSSLSPLQIRPSIKADRPSAHSFEDTSTPSSPPFLMPPTSAPPSTSTFPSLSLRPVSGLFSEHFQGHILQALPLRSARDGFPSRTSSGSTSTTTPLTSPLPPSPLSRSSIHSPTAVECRDSEAAYMNLQDQIFQQKRTWLHQIVEMEKQIKELREEIDNLRTGEKCLSCGRGGTSWGSHHGVLNRLRSRSAHDTRTLFGGKEG